MSDTATTHLAGLGPMLRLDIANLATWRRSGPVIIVALLFLAWMGGLQMASIMLYIGWYLIAVNAFTMDDNHRLPLLYGGLPVTRRTVVTSHYLIALAALAAAALLIVPAALISASRPEGGLFADEVGIGLGTLLGTSAALAVMIPLIVRFGSRALGYVALGIMAVFAFVALAVGPWIAAPAARLTAWAAANPVLATAVAVVLLVAAWLASYLASVRLYAAKDF